MGTFKAYIASLPPEPVNNYPFWPERWRNAADGIMGTELRNLYEMERRYLGRLGNLLHNLGDGEAFSAAEIDRAISVTTSRSVLQRLVPILDFANHDFEENAAFGCDEVAAMCYLRMKRPVAAGEQILVNYGHRGNLQLLAVYGFHVPANPCSTVA